MTRGHLLAAAGVVLLANAAAVGIAAYNRSGDPTATIVLTERELALPPADPENTGLWLELRWQQPVSDLAPADVDARARRDRAALESLGFDLSLPLTDPAARAHYRRLLARTGFVVFEFDGESWRAFADAVSRGADDPERAGAGGARPGALPADAADRRRRERLGGSRLVPVDAGTDAAVLRRRYPDAARFLVVPGVIRLALVEPTTAAPGRFALRLAQVWPAVIHVPKQHRALFDTLARERPGLDDRWSSPDRPPRYMVTVSYGRRHEPWIAGVGSLPAGAGTAPR